MPGLQQRQCILDGRRVRIRGAQCLQHGGGDRGTAFRVDRVTPATIRVLVMQQELQRAADRQRIGICLDQGQGRQGSIQRIAVVTARQSPTAIAVLQRQQTIQGIGDRIIAEQSHLAGKKVAIGSLVVTNPLNCRQGIIKHVVVS